jgi:alpha-tubulin suppressor-like RCC1 family protein
LKNYFANKNILTSDSIPTQGKFKIGDIVVNTGNDAKENPFWICTESGSPGSWQSINVKSESKLYAFKNKVIISEAKTNIDMGIGVISNRDILLVFINDKLAYENIDYTIEGNTIKAINDNVWNDILANDFAFEFIAFKSILNTDETFELTNENAPNGIVTFNKLSKDIKDRIDTATADLSIYQDISDNNLSTNSKTVVGAINELVQNIDAGKGLIANATGKNTVTKDSSYEELSNVIVELKQDVIKKQEFEQYKNKVNQYADDLSEIMIDNGCEITGQETLSELIDILVANGLKINDIERIECKHLTSIIYKKDGTAFLCGNIEDDILNDGTTGSSGTFKILKVTDVKQIGIGTSHTMVLKNDGTLWAIGINVYGQLGAGSNYSSISTLTKVADNIAAVDCGESHTVALTNDGAVIAAGRNKYGQVGYSDFQDKLSFITVASGAKQITCGSNHNMILKDDGYIYSCGYGADGELGNGSLNNSGAYGKVTVISDVKQVLCAGNHSVALKNDGTLWVSGSNFSGQFGNGESGGNSRKYQFSQVTTNISDDVESIVECDGNFIIVKKKDGTYWGSGDNQYGQFGLGTTGTVYYFTQIDVPDLSKVKDISFGYYHGIVMHKDGTLYSCGYNGEGELGNGTVEASNTTIFTKINL